MELRAFAQERIKAAFIKTLENAPVSETDRALFLRISTVLDAHYAEYCSFYDREAIRIDLSEKPYYYFSLLSRLTDYERLSVSELTKSAGVNRATFYKHFPNVNALYDACCSDVTNRFLSVPVPTEKTPDAMLAYGSTLWSLMEKNNELLFTLSHRVRKLHLQYLMGTLLKEQLGGSLTAAEASSFRVQENLAVFPELFSIWFGLIQIEQLIPGLYPDRELPAYRPDRSLIENIADLFVSRYGGSFDFYYALGGAGLKLLAEKRFNNISVSELCKTAGYSRRSFYESFTDHADYVMKACENIVLTCFSAFIYFLEHQDMLTPENMAVFRGIAVDYKIKGLHEIFRNGSITFVFPILFAYLMRRFVAEETRRRGAPTDTAFHSLLSYYLALAIHFFSLNYLGDMTDAELFVRVNELARIKKKLWGK